MKDLNSYEFDFDTICRLTNQPRIFLLRILF